MIWPTEAPSTYIDTAWLNDLMRLRNANELKIAYMISRGEANGALVTPIVIRERLSLDYRAVAKALGTLLAARLIREGEGGGYLTGESYTAPRASR